MPNLSEMNYIQELLDGSKYTHLSISKHLDSQKDWQKEVCVKFYIYSYNYD